MENRDKLVQWTGEINSVALETLRGNGGVIVSPTKVGYIIMTTDAKGLDRKFQIKDRKRNKPGVVLCGSMGQLEELAEINAEIKTFYQKHWDQDILLGCILPWKKSGKKYIPKDKSSDLMMDTRQTSCFVIRFGKPSEQLAQTLWQKDRKLIFASSANPSGKGNRGVVTGIGPQIEEGADLIIAADHFVASMQPNKDEKSRYEQGVMISMVDEKGTLIPQQEGKRGVLPAPVLIRKGLDVDIITNILSDHFNTWDYRQGAYY